MMKMLDLEKRHLQIKRKTCIETQRNKKAAVVNRNIKQQPNKHAATGVLFSWGIDNNDIL